MRGGIFIVATGFFVLSTYYVIADFTKGQPLNDMLYTATLIIFSVNCVAAMLLTHPLPTRKKQMRRKIWDSISLKK